MIKNSVIILITVFVCITSSLLSAVNIDSSTVVTPKIVAHRGASVTAPENTMAAIKLAWELGADIVEIDVRLTKDKHIVLMHDPSAKRTSGHNLAISTVTLSEVQCLDVGRQKNEKYTGEKVPLLEDVLKTIPEGKEMFVEIKVGKEIIPELKRVIESSGKAAQVVIIGFSQPTVVYAKEQIPGIRGTFQLLREVRDSKTKNCIPYNFNNIDVIKKIGLTGLDVHYASLTEEFIKKAHAEGIKIVVWTVNNIENMKRYAAWGVDYITTDTAEDAIRVLKKPF
ncbi:MAG: glycerophosphodiester phosphodiesterase [Elusimicrobiota bacterium]